MSAGTTVFLLGGGLLILIGTVASLWAGGFVNFAPQKEEFVIPPGWVAVPMSARPIAANSKIAREDLWDAAASRWTTFPLPAQQVSAEMLVDPRQILGRVLVRDKPPGYVFTERDFYPVGTRAGLVAAIPPGKRAMTLASEKIQGIHLLKVGDEFDLLASFTWEPQETSGVRNRHGSALVVSPGAASDIRPSGTQAEVEVLVQGGVVISALSIRQVPVASASLTQGLNTKLQPVQEVVVAVEPEEVALLAEAVSTGRTLTCVARSGHPDDDPMRTRIPGSQKRSAPPVLETIVGEERKSWIFPQASSSATLDVAPHWPPVHSAAGSTALSDN